MRRLARVESNKKQGIPKKIAITKERYQTQHDDTMSEISENWETNGNEVKMKTINGGDVSVMSEEEIRETMKRLQDEAKKRKLSLVDKENIPDETASSSKVKAGRPFKIARPTTGKN